MKSLSEEIALKYTHSFVIYNKKPAFVVEVKNNTVILRTHSEPTQIHVPLSDINFQTFLLNEGYYADYTKKLVFYVSRVANKVSQKSFTIDNWKFIIPSVNSLSTNLSLIKSIKWDINAMLLWLESLSIEYDDKYKYILVQKIKPTLNWHCNVLSLDMVSYRLAPDQLGFYYRDTLIAKSKYNQLNQKISDLNIIDQQLESQLISVIPQELYGNNS